MKVTDIRLWKQPSPMLYPARHYDEWRSHCMKSWI